MRAAIFDEPGLTNLKEEKNVNKPQKWKQHYQETLILLDTSKHLYKHSDIAIQCLEYNAQYPSH